MTVMNQITKPGFERRHEDLKWRSSSFTQKFSQDQMRFAIAKLGYEPKGSELLSLFKEPEDGVIEDNESNLLVTVGLARITSLITGAGGTSLTHANAVCGVGDTATAAVVADTQLGSNSTAHSRYIVADTTFPTSSNGVITMQNTFTTTDGNFVWAEWGWVVAAAAANSDTFAGITGTPLLLNHKIAALGTKASGASWIFTSTVTLS